MNHHYHHSPSPTTTRNRNHQKSSINQTTIINISHHHHCKTNTTCIHVLTIANHHALLQLGFAIHHRFVTHYDNHHTHMPLPTDPATPTTSVLPELVTGSHLEPSYTTAIPNITCYYNQHSPSIIIPCYHRTVIPPSSPSRNLKQPPRTASAVVSNHRSHHTSSLL